MRLNVRKKKNYKDMLTQSSAFLILFFLIVPFRLSAQNLENIMKKEKKTLSDWRESYNKKGERRVYSGDQLLTIGMPCGGIASGQLYVRGDGTLAGWWNANNAYNTGYGIDELLNFYTPYGVQAIGYQTFEPQSSFSQGFNLLVTDKQKTIKRPLNKSGFNNIRFAGEYPIATIEYNDEKNPIPLEVSLDVFSPFIPLNSKESSLPATILEFSIKNISEVPLDIALEGYLQNMIMSDLKDYIAGTQQNSIKSENGITALYMNFKEQYPKEKIGDEYHTFDDFEDFSLNKKWKIENASFSEVPTSLGLMKNLTGFQGYRALATGLANSDATGRIVSTDFIIKNKYISFLIGGFDRLDKTNISLVVDGRVVNKASGNNSGIADTVNWNVERYIGKKGHFEINDLSGKKGQYIAVDNIRFSDIPLYKQIDVNNHPYNGNMSLSLLDDKGTVSPDVEEKSPTRSLGQKLIGSIDCSFHLLPGKSRKIRYLLTWYFPNRPFPAESAGWNKPVETGGMIIGNNYSNWFSSSFEVARYVRENFDRLSNETRLFCHTYYNETSIPYWLSQRIMMPVSTLATETCQWWANNKFWAWEGVGSCLGTCTHVWNYEQALSRLFPDLERNIRESTDFSTSYRDDGGIYTRNGGGKVHIDGQAGTILKAYREHLISDNRFFLSRNWEKIRKATEFLIALDGNEDGLIEGQQRNTYDVAFMGANPYVGGLYLAGLRAAEKMALIMNDTSFAKKCKKIYTSGSELSVSKLWNGEYFFQDVDLKKYPRNQFGKGCLSDQLFGQTWAHQLDLGYIYPENEIRKTMSSIWKYNWTTDVGPYNQKHPPERSFAKAGEPGLLNCTWPLTEHPGENGVRYRDEVWTGIEYQVGTEMIYEGMLDQGLSIVKAIDERYSPEKHNPWNEIECGDHYARAMASWGVLIAIERYYFNGPEGLLSFNPIIQKDNFNGFFTGSKGWGNLQQKREGTNQENVIEVKWGELRIKQLKVNVESVPTELKLFVGDKIVKPSFKVDNNTLAINFEESILRPGIPLRLVVN